LLDFLDDVLICGMKVFGSSCELCMSKDSCEQRQAPRVIAWLNNVYELEMAGTGLHRVIVGECTRTKRAVANDFGQKSVHIRTDEDSIHFLRQYGLPTVEIKLVDLCEAPEAALVISEALKALPPRGL
jgi:hypothetical protein